MDSDLPCQSDEMITSLFTLAKIHTDTFQTVFRSERGPELGCNVPGLSWFLILMLDSF